jgi:hypothetical protein
MLHSYIHPLSERELNVGSMEFPIPIAALKRAEKPPIFFIDVVRENCSDYSSV